MIGALTASVAVYECQCLDPSVINFSRNNSDLIEHTLYSRSRVRGTLRAWSEEALKDSGYRPAAHHLYLVSELENLYPVHARIWKSLGEMIRKLSDTVSQ
jgi:hypothetical protein